MGQAEGRRRILVVGLVCALAAGAAALLALWAQSLGLLPVSAALPQIARITEVSFPSGVRVVHSRYQAGLAPPTLFAELLFPGGETSIPSAAVTASGRWVLVTQSVSEALHSNALLQAGMPAPSWWLRPDRAASAAEYTGAGSGPGDFERRMVIAPAKATAGERHVYLWWHYRR